jgi:hypothetical protein
VPGFALPVVIWQQVGSCVFPAAERRGGIKQEARLMRVSRDHDSCQEILRNNFSPLQKQIFGHVDKLLQKFKIPDDSPK